MNEGIVFLKSCRITSTFGYAILMRRCSNVSDDGQAVDTDESTLSDGTTLDGVLVAAEIVRGCSPTQAYNGLPRNTAEDSDRRAASANGDVQAGDIDAEQRLD
jgi:hypothetical protein